VVVDVPGVLVAAVEGDRRRRDRVFEPNEIIRRGPIFSPGKVKESQRSELQSVFYLYSERSPLEGVTVTMGSKRKESETAPEKYGARHWCLTIRAHKDRPLVIIEDAAIQHKLRFATWQREEGGDTGYVHWQAYAEFAQPVKGVTCRLVWGHRGDRGQLRRLESGDVHWERRRGTRLEARDYCRKEDTRSGSDGSGPFEWGSYCRSDCIYERCNSTSDYFAPCPAGKCDGHWHRRACDGQREAFWDLWLLEEIQIDMFPEDCVPEGLYYVDAPHTPLIKLL